jgi:hypothetical protein
MEFKMSINENSRHGGAMSVDAFALWAGIGRTTAWNEIRLGKLRAVKANARTLITFDDAQHWLSSRPTVHEASSKARPTHTCGKP